MNDRSKPSFARRIRDAKPRARKYELWDDAISGLGLCIRPSGTRTFFLRRNVRGRIRYATIGRTDDVTLAQAHREARGLIVTFLGTARKDNGPGTPGRPMDAFAAEFLERQARHWKPATLETNKAAIRNHILPAFGRMRIDEIGPVEVAAWFDAASRDRPGAANRALEILRAMMFKAEEWGWRERDANPCLGIRKNPRRKVARFLDADELERLGRALDAREAEWPEAVAAIRLLALTGCRGGKVLDLRWRDIGTEAIHLPDSKTGPRSVPLGEGAKALLDALSGERCADAFLFPRYAQSQGRFRFATRWRAVCEGAGLGRLRLHDLRHTYASHAVMSGENLPLVGRLLGHRRHRTTAGYAHLTDEHLVEAAEKVGSIIAVAMNASVLSSTSSNTVPHDSFQMLRH